MSIDAILQRASATALIVAICASSARAQTSTQDLLNWGLDVYAKTTASLQVPGSKLFAETASLSGQRSGGDGGFAYVWPLSTQFRVQTALVRHDPAAYATTLRQFSDEARARYWKAAGGGYRSGVSSGATLFYDDNAHMVVALMEAFRLTADPVYLSRAQETYNFVLSGEDLAGGGGIYFSQPDHTVKETISTLQGARAALMLYRATAQPSYLQDATRLYEWCRTHVQEPDGMFLERYYLTGPKAGTAGDFALVNGPGDAISVQLEFFAATGNVANLQEAQRMAARSLSRFFNPTTGAINDEGFWAFELVDALCELTRVDGNPLWRNRTITALRWLHDNRRDPNGHYDALWGRGGVQTTALASWDLNDNAAVGRSFLQAALTEPLPGDFNADGVVDAADLARWSAGFGVATGALLSQGDADRDRDVDGADFLVWQRQMGSDAPVTGASAPVPEPPTVALLILAAVSLRALQIGRRRNYAGRRLPAWRPTPSGAGAERGGVAQQRDAAQQKKAPSIRKSTGPLVRGTLRRRREVSRRSGQLNLSTAPIFYLYPRAFSSVTGYALVSERLGRSGAFTLHASQAEVSFRPTLSWRQRASAGVRPAGRRRTAS